MIYFARIDKTWDVKIGCTNQEIRKRIWALQTQCNSKVTLLGIMNGNLEEEKKVHRLFKHLNKHGREWYRWDISIIDFIRFAGNIEYDKTDEEIYEEHLSIVHF